VIKLYCQHCEKYTANMELKVKPGTEYRMTVICPECVEKEKPSADMPDFLKDLLRGSMK
jgi:protein-arginine kinase activator protein McsA